MALKAVPYLLSCNLSEILARPLATLFALSLPLLPVQIPWINLATDLLPAVMFTVDPADLDLMHRPQWRLQAQVLNQRCSLLDLTVPHRHLASEP